MLGLRISIAVLAVCMAVGATVYFSSRVQGPVPEVVSGPAEAKHGQEKLLKIIAPLVDTAKIDRLRSDGAAVGRIRKICHWLEIARREGIDPDELISAAQRMNEIPDPNRAKAQKGRLLENLHILESLGCFDADGMAKLKSGKAPKVKKGDYYGEIVEGDHIIPKSACEDLINRLFNIRFMPQSQNREKGAKVGPEQRRLAEEWHRDGLIDDEALSGILAR